MPLDKLMLEQSFKFHPALDGDKWPYSILDISYHVWVPEDEHFTSVAWFHETYSNGEREVIAVVYPREFVYAFRHGSYYVIHTDECCATHECSRDYRTRCPQWTAYFHDASIVTCCKKGDPVELRGRVEPDVPVWNFHRGETKRGRKGPNTLRPGELDTKPVRAEFIRQMDEHWQTDVRFPNGDA